jgi:hypothetical protein
VHLGAFAHLNASRTISTRTAAQSLVQMTYARHFSHNLQRVRFS